MASHTSNVTILLTHSRSCSTVIERVFWKNPDIKCYHEHFGDAFYFGPEKISDNWKTFSPGRIERNGKGNVTYKSALDDMIQSSNARQHVFDKDMSYHVVPPENSDIKAIPSLKNWCNESYSNIENPTWLPTSIVNSFNFGFLIRSPWLAVPSLYRLHQPPACYETEVYNFKPMEIGYREMRVLIEYLYPRTCKPRTVNGINDRKHNSASAESPIVIDASDVLANPEPMLHKFCAKLGLPFSPSMLAWEPYESEVEKEFSKFPGFHHDAIASSGLRQQTQDEEARASARRSSSGMQTKRRQDGQGMDMTEEEYMTEWTERYGRNGAEVILETVKLCIEDYSWLKRLVMVL